MQELGTIGIVNHFIHNSVEEYQPRLWALVPYGSSQATQNGSDPVRNWRCSGKEIAQEIFLQN